MKKDYVVLFANVILIAFLIFKNINAPNFGSDYFYQHAAAQNIIDFGEYSLLDNDSSCSIDRTTRLTSFPIGYSLLISPLVKIVEYPQQVHTIIYIFSLLVLSICTFFIAKKLFRNTIYSLLTVFISLFFCLKGHTVDILSFSILLLGIYGLASSFSKQRPLYFALFLSLISLLCVFRFAYYPQLIFIPISIVIVLFGARAKRVKIQYLISLIIPLIFVVVYAYWWVNFSDEVNRLETTIEGSNWNFEHISHFRPLFIDYFIDTYRFYSFLGFDSIDYDRGFEIPFVLRIITLTFSLFLFVLSSAYLFRKGKSSSCLFQKYFLLSITLSSVINLLFIYFLSFYYGSASSEYIWTWAMLPRYFIINFFTFSIFLVYVIKESSSLISRLVYYCLISFIVLNTADSIRLQTKVYTLNIQENIDIKYPGYCLNDLNALYSEYIEDRGQYCIIINQENSLTPKQIQWITIYGQLLFFSTRIEEINNKEQYSPFSIGNERIFLKKRVGQFK